MDIKHSLGTEILAVRACYQDDGADLLAVAGESIVEVLQCEATSVKVIAVFHLGLRPTALAWSPRSTSPTVADDWFIELAVSTHDFGLHILTKTYDDAESVFRFGGGLTGHHARINDLSFVGGEDRTARHLASVSDDKNLIVWDLYPPAEPEPESSSNPASPRVRTPEGPQRQPTALVIPFAHPLNSVSFHPSTSKEFLVSDSRGCVFLVDWRKNPEDMDDEVIGQHSVAEFVHPRALADACTNLARYFTGYASWRRDNPNIIGAVFGTGFAIWDMDNLQGGKPSVTGVSYPEGANRFKWSSTYPEYFAISSATASRKGASIHLYNAKYLHAQPNVISISPLPRSVRDFDWLATPGIPRLAVAYGRDIVIFPISFE